MKRNWLKQWLVLLLCLALALSAVPAPTVWAEQDAPEGEAAETSAQETTERLSDEEENGVDITINYNPLMGEPTEAKKAQFAQEFRELMEAQPPEEFAEVHSAASTPAADAIESSERPGWAEPYFKTLDDAVSYIRQKMVEREIHITVYLPTEQTLDKNGEQFTSSQMHSIVFADTGRGYEGDYFLLHMGMHGIGVGECDGYGFSQITCGCVFNDTKEMEEAVTAAVGPLLDSFDLEGKSDYEKTSIIYDWICTHVSYDWEGEEYYKSHEITLSSEGFTDEDRQAVIPFTAYSAMILGKAVCQGYALLTYRLMWEAGIPCKLILGTVNGNGHAWNIVKLGDWYYNIDTTWDANYTNHFYFLKSDQEYRNAGKVRDYGYSTLTFQKQYPTSLSSYGESYDASFCGEGLTWSLEEHTLMIQGTGSMADFTGTCPWTSEADSIDSVIVGEGVTYIGEYCFAGLPITSVSLPQSLLTIGDSAFRECENLGTIVFPPKLCTIGRYAFCECRKLSAISFDACTELRVIQFCAFNSCSPEILRLPEGLTTVEDSSFGDIYVKDLYYPSTLQIRGYAGLPPSENLYVAMDVSQWMQLQHTSSKPEYEHVFFNGEDATDLIIPSGTTTIPFSAFSNMQGITSVWIPASVEVIDYQAFAGCRNLKSILFEEGSQLKSIKSHAFSGSGIESVQLPESVSELVAPFAGCKSLESFSFPPLVTEMAADSFNGCQSLKSVILPEGLTSIPQRAFSGCSSLETFSIPDTVSEIGDRAFSSCKSLWEIVIPETVEKIGNYAFSYCSSLREIVIPSSVRSIGDSAFSDFSSIMHRIRFLGAAPVGVSQAFGDGRAFVYHPSGDPSWTELVQQQDFETFIYCISDDYYPKSPEVLACGPCGAEGDDVSWYLLFDKSLHVSGTGAMKDYSQDTRGPWDAANSWIDTVIVEPGVTRIGDYAFYIFESTSSASIADTVTTIGESAFEYCYNLTSLDIPGSVINIGQSAFGVCNSLQTVTFRGHAPNIYWDSFIIVTATVCYPANDPTWTYAVRQSYGGTLTWKAYAPFGTPTFTLPASIKTIEESAFEGLPVTVVDIPSGCESIGKWAFKDCTGLTQIRIPESVTEIDDMAFDGCVNVFIYGASASTAQTFCNTHENCIFITENTAA